jgi:hypothetical protein
MTIQEMPVEPQRHGRNWDAVTAIVAVMIGVLALLISGYTAYIQRQQVRAEVWPRLLLASFTSENALKLLNKGVGPAIVRSVRIAVDDRPQRDWKAVRAALGLAPAPLRTSTIGDYVVSADEEVPVLVFDDAERLREFRDAARTRVTLDICYCSTLGDCWTYLDRMSEARPTVTPVAVCPILSDAERFEE